MTAGESLLLVTPLIVGALFSQIVPIKLRPFLGVYLILTAAQVLISYLVLNLGVLAPVISSVVGVVVMLVLTGFFGDRLRASDYALAGVGMGLFPWVSVGFPGFVIYAICFTGLVTINALRPRIKSPFRRSYKR